MNKQLPSNRALKPLWLLPIAVLAVTGCQTHVHEPSSPQAGQTDVPKNSVIEQTPSVYEKALSDRTQVRFLETGIIEFKGHLDEEEKFLTIRRALEESQSIEEAFRVLEPEAALPQSLKDLGAGLQPTIDEGMPPQFSSLGEETKALAAPKSSGSAHHANPSSDASWDWNADASWWKSDVVGYRCGDYQALHSTNYTWIDYNKQGYNHRGYLMAASHTYGADAYEYLWSGGKWVETARTYLPARHYVTYSRATKDASARYRRYRVVGGGGPYARTHLGIRWYTKKPDPNIGTICL